MLGAGAGGTLTGYIAAGCNVWALEKDPQQFTFLQTRLTKMSVNWAAEKESWDALIAKSQNVRKL